MEIERGLFILKHPIGSLPTFSIEVYSQIIYADYDREDAKVVDWFQRSYSVVFFILFKNKFRSDRYMIFNRLEIITISLIDPRFQ